MLMMAQVCAACCRSQALGGTACAASAQSVAAELAQTASAALAAAAALTLTVVLYVCSAWHPWCCSALYLSLHQVHSMPYTALLCCRLGTRAGAAASAQHLRQ